MQREREREKEKRKKRDYSSCLSQFNMPCCLFLALFLSPCPARPLEVKTEMAKLTNVDNGSQSDKRTDCDTQAHRKFCCNEPATSSTAWQGKGEEEEGSSSKGNRCSDCPDDWRHRLTGTQQLVIRCCTEHLGSTWGCAASESAKRGGGASRASVDHDKRCLTKFNNRWQLQFTAWRRRPHSQDICANTEIIIMTCRTTPGRVVQRARSVVDCQEGQRGGRGEARQT